MIESALIPEFAGVIDGKWQGADTGKTLSVVNPATGELLADVPDMGAAETNTAIAAGTQALLKPTSLEQRREWLRAIVAALAANREELARIITLEQGKPLKESRVEVDYAAGFFRFSADHLDHIAPHAVERQTAGGPVQVFYRPAGVAGVVTPWNFPLAMLAKKLAAAIGAGCSVVAKPSELTPLTTIALWSLFEQIGIPAGRLNLVLGYPTAIGKVLCEHPAVRVLSFTGSTRVGKQLLAETAPYVKRLTLELGGNAPFIVFEDADVDGAVEALMANKFRCAGQTCVCTNRVYVQEAVQSAFVEKLAPRVAALRVGNGMDAETDIGPLINRAGFDKVSRHVQDALAKGAKRLVGENVTLPENDWGCFYPPTVLTGMTAEMVAFQEETFGPVVSIASFRSEAEVLAAANATPYGLASYVFTQDTERGLRCAERLQAGHVGLNTGAGPTPEAPFGGMKQSGIGREGGLEALVEFCEPQTLISK